MGKKSLILLAVFLTAVLGLVALKSPPSPPDPVYHGKPLSMWLAELRLKSSNGQIGYDTPADDAIRHIGTNAFPMILQRLGYEDSKPKLLLMRLCRGSRFYAPLNSRFHFDRQRDYHFEAVEAISALNSVAKPLATDVAVALSHMDRVPQEIPIRMKAGSWLSSLGSDGESTIPDLIRIIDDKNDRYRFFAVHELAMVGERKANIVQPVFTACLQDTNNWVRQYANVELSLHPWASVKYPDYPGIGVLLPNQTSVEQLTEQ